MFSFYATVCSTPIAIEHRSVVLDFASQYQKASEGGHYTSREAVFNVYNVEIVCKKSIILGIRLNRQFKSAWSNHYMSESITNCCGSAISRTWLALFPRPLRSLTLLSDPTTKLATEIIELIPDFCEHITVMCVAQICQRWRMCARAHGQYYIDLKFDVPIDSIILDQQAHIFEKNNSLRGYLVVY